MSDASDKTKPRRRGWLRLAVILGIAIAAIAGVYSLGLHKLLSFEMLKAQQDGLKAWVAANPALAFAAFIGTYALFTLLMIPGALWLTIGGGFLFGVAAGAAATVTGATAGAVALFLAARTTFGDALRARAGPFLARLESGFAESPLSYMFTLRFLPIVPFPVANIAPALLGAKLRDFVVTTALGVLPAVVAYSWVGAGLAAAFAEDRPPDTAGFARSLAPGFFALAAVSLAPALFKRLTRKKATPA